jgi:hypothetical protein
VDVGDGETAVGDSIVVSCSLELDEVITDSEDFFS